MMTPARETAAHADLIDLLDEMLDAGRRCTWETPTSGRRSPEGPEGCDEDREPGSGVCLGHGRDAA